MDAILGFALALGDLLWVLASFVAALSVIVVVHEYGHYIVGRWSGLQADVFSVGFGPVIYARTDRRGTCWQIAALPFGGYVKFAGDGDAASSPDTSAMQHAAQDPAQLRRTLYGAPIWARFATVLAGPVFNFIFAALIYAGIALSAGQLKEPLTVNTLHPMPNFESENSLRPGDIILKIDGHDLSEYLAGDIEPNAPELSYEVERDGRVHNIPGPYLWPARVAYVALDSAAQQAGLAVGDVIIAVDGRPIYRFQELKQAVETSGGRSLDLLVWHSGTQRQVFLTPQRMDEPAPDGGFHTQWRIGIGSGMAFGPQTTSLALAQALEIGALRTWRTITLTISGLQAMIIGDISTCNLSGPIGIAKISGEMARQGPAEFIVLLAWLSAVVGFMNLLPVPVLDGGHLVFFAYEAIRGKPPSPAILRLLMSAGLGLVLCLMILALSMDLFCP